MTTLATMRRLAIVVFTLCAAVIYGAAIAWLLGAL